MITGEELFAELIPDESNLDKNFITLYQPFEAKVFQGENRMQMMLSPWQVFTDDLTYLVQAHHVVSINSLDERNTKIYGSMVVNTELKIIQNEVSHEVQLGTITSKRIDNALKETLMVLMKSGMKYNLPMPELNQVKHDFYTFLMGQYEDVATITH